VAEDLGEVETALGRNHVGVVGAKVRLDGRDYGISDALGGRDPGVAVEAVDEVGHTDTIRVRPGMRSRYHANGGPARLLFDKHPGPFRHDET